MSRGKIMKLQVEQAKEHIGKKFPYSYTISASELGDVTAFPWSRHDITISGEFWFDGQNYIVQGSIQSKGNYDCSRCLNTTEHYRKDFFEEIFSDSREATDDVIPFDGEEIDLTELIRDTLIINEPSQVLCQDDCKGLCVHCGANLNVSPCSFSNNSHDSFNLREYDFYDIWLDKLKVYRIKNKNKCRRADCPSHKQCRGCCSYYPEITTCYVG